MLPVLWPQLTPGHYAFSRTRLLSALASFFASLTGPPGVSHSSFAAQPPDLLLRSYVYLSVFGLICTLTHRLALYPVSLRRLLGFATPLPSLLSLLTAACGSLRLAVTTRGGTFTRENCAMPGTQINGLLQMYEICSSPFLCTELSRILFLHAAKRDTRDDVLAEGKVHNEERKRRKRQAEIDGTELRAVDVAAELFDHHRQRFHVRIGE